MTGGIRSVFRGSRFESDEEIGQKRAFFKGLGQDCRAMETGRIMRVEKKTSHEGRNNPDVVPFQILSGAH